MYMLHVPVRADACTCCMALADKKRGGGGGGGGGGGISARYSVKGFASKNLILY